MTREPTPYQDAKATNHPYLKLTIDDRHWISPEATARGKVTIEGAVSAETFLRACGLLEAILADGE